MPSKYVVPMSGIKTAPCQYQSGARPSKWPVANNPGGQTAVRRRYTALSFVFALTVSSAHSQDPAGEVDRPTDEVGRIVGEVLTRGEQVRYMHKLADEIGQRLTGSPNAVRAEEAVSEWLSEMGLDNVHFDPFEMGARWTRRTAAASMTSPYTRPLIVGSYTWTPSTEPAGLEGPIIDVGTGSPEEVKALSGRAYGSIALVSPMTTSLDEVIENLYRTPELVGELADAGAKAVLIASDKEDTLLYTAPVSFGAEASVSALPVLSVAQEDVGLLRRLLTQGEVRVRVAVENEVGPAFQSRNVVGEIRGSERPQEIVLLGAHLDSNDLGSGAVDNAAGCAGLLETARAIKALGLQPRRTLRFVFFMGEEEGLVGSTAYVKQHLDYLDDMVAVLIMDIGAGRPLGWFSMGRTDLDPGIERIMAPLQAISGSAIVHASFAATDNAAFMAAGVPNLVMIQDDSSYVPVHHTAADTPDKADQAAFAAAVATLAATAFQLADEPDRFGRRLTPAEIQKMMDESAGLERQWRAAGIWPLTESP